ncbi:MAG TPA: hypothetical protein PLR06_05960 [Cyclobacteriaceae bacterium]|nr:hypothetical protein [Cyclobacteriaceae bacterium]
MNSTDVKTRLKIVGIKIVEWLIRTFHIYFQQFDKRGLVIAIILVSIPLSLNTASLIIYLFSLALPGLLFKAGFFGISGLAFIGYIVINTCLESEYVKKKKKINGGFHFLFYLVSPIYFFGSLWLFVLSFRFL